MMEWPAQYEHTELLEFLHIFGFVQPSNVSQMFLGHDIQLSTRNIAWGKSKIMFFLLGLWEHVVFLIEKVVATLTVLGFHLVNFICIRYTYEKLYKAVEIVSEKIICKRSEPYKNHWAHSVS